MKSQDCKYSINGQNYRRDELLAFCQIMMREASPWESDLYRFIDLWLGDSPIIPMFSSGSTGDPKTIEFSRVAVEASARASIDFFGLQEGDRVLLCLPIRYVAARLMVVRALVGGLDLCVVPPSGNPLAHVGTDLAFAAMVPLQVMDVLAQTPQQFNLVDKLIVGGSAVTPQLKRQLQNVTTQVWETYGMTETLTHVAVRQINGNNQTECFGALPGVSFSVDTNGCLVIDVPRITPLPMVTRDMVRLIDSSHFELLGRYDNVINSGGIKLQPEVIEARLRPFIPGLFVVMGMPDARLGEKVVLVAERSPEPLDLRMIMVTSGLGKYEKPKEIIFVEKIPVGENGKILRRQLLQGLQNDITNKKH